MSSNPDNNPPDEELSDMIDDSEGDSVDQLNEGIVEAGIPPEIEDESTDSVDESCFRWTILTRLNCKSLIIQSKKKLFLHDTSIPFPKPSHRLYKENHFFNDAKTV